MVTPEEIERVDVMYGPFSAAYPGGSVGAVVDYQTRMPDKSRSPCQAGPAFQPGFQIIEYKRALYNGGQGSASVVTALAPGPGGSTSRALDNGGQPLTYANKLVSGQALPATPAYR